jgi:hypothetical protein
LILSLLERFFLEVSESHGRERKRCKNKKRFKCHNSRTY